VGEETVQVSASTGCLIGRANDCHLRVADGLSSRHHARCRETPRGLVVEDLESRNGVLVNQRKISAPTIVKHGDVIGIGLTSIEVVDNHYLRRPEHLSTLPPPSTEAAVVDARKIPVGMGDMDGPAQMTTKATLDPLSAREREVLQLLVLGHTQREIADKLHVSVKTIESHRSSIGAKLGCESRAELVAYALSAGLLSASLAAGKTPGVKSG
jgi:DNA-binding CsgD family transcriptional regulator